MAEKHRYLERLSQKIYKTVGNKPNKHLINFIYTSFIWLIMQYGIQFELYGHLNMATVSLYV